MNYLQAWSSTSFYQECPSNLWFRFQCVSKLWCDYIDDPYLHIIHYQRGSEEHTPIMFHINPAHLNLPNTPCFHLDESKKDTTGVLQPGFQIWVQNGSSQSPRFLQWACLFITTSWFRSSQFGCDPSSKETWYYELPPLPLPL